MSFFLKKTFIIGFAIIFLLFSTADVSAAILTVTTLADTDDSICDSHCSLREAIKTAASGDTITFDRNLRGGTIQLEKTLGVGKRLTIDGPNKRRITVKGNGTFRIFHLKVSDLGRVVTLDGLIIRDGAEANGDGGGIYVDPLTALTLNITNCAIINNTAMRGGGVFMRSPGTLYLIDSTVAGNIATADNSGGGIDVFRSTVKIMNSTISGNQSTSTIAGAGGILFTDSQDWFINGSTIAFNSAAGTSSTAAGGLVALNGIPGPLSNVILAQNTGLNPDFYGHSSGARNSLIGVTDDRSGFINGVNGNIVGSYQNPVDSHLGILTDNGGGLPTHALMPNSQAIDAGNNVLSIDRTGQPLTVDQRNYGRLVGTNVDMGSFEFNSQPVNISSTLSGQVFGVNRNSIANVRIQLINQNVETRFAATNPFGFFRFVNLPTNSVYTIECFGKRGEFQRQQVVFAEELIEYINF